MAEPKNIFNFGTGDIDKDQWLRDIDSELENFISKYGMATNKHRTALLRQAFQDLRTRIANGDMLNRTADGRYQFGSMLNRDDKHMQEAYERALGFMGGLARRQITAPPAEPEKKKYNTKTLNDRFIKFFNPSGNLEAFTSLWNSYDDNTRKTKLLEFLRSELNTGLSNYQDVEDYDSMDNLRTRISNFISDPNITNLNSLGFNKNYLSQLTTTILEEEEPKSELDLQEEALALQIDLFTRTQALEEKKQLLAWALDALNYKGENFGLLGFIPYNFEVATKGKTNDEINDYYTKSSTELDNYFKNLAVNWRNYLQGRQSIALNHNLSKLFSSFDNLGKINYHFADLINKYFTPVQGGFLLKGTNEENGRNVYYVPGKEFTVTAHNNPWAGISSLKEGGVLKYLVGGGLDAYMDYKKALLSQLLETTKQETFELSNTLIPQISKADWVRLSSIIPDIISIGSAYGGPVGSIVSGISGLTSTVMNAGADFSEGNTTLGWTTLLSGAGADVLGLIPGWGTAAKLKKVASTLKGISRTANVLFMSIGAHDAVVALNKIIEGKEVTSKDWMDLANGLKMGLQGGLKWGAGSGRVAGKRLQNLAVTHYDIPLTNGTKYRATKAEFEEYRNGKGKLTGVAEENILKKPKGKPVVTQEGLKNSRELMLNEYGFFGNITDRGFQNYMNRAGSNGYVYKQWDPSGLNIFKDRLEARKLYLKNLKSNEKPQVPLLTSAPLNGSDVPVVVPNENANGSLPLIVSGDGILPSQPVRRRITHYRINPTEAWKQKLILRRQRRVESLRLRELARDRAAMLTDIPTPEMSTYSVMAEARRRLQESLRLNSRWSLEEIPDNHALPIGRKLGGILKALRNGGIIKAKWGDNTSDWMTPLYNPEKQEEKAIYTNPYFPNIKYNGTAPWYKSRFSGESVINLGNDASGRANLPGGLTGNNLDYAFARNQAYVKSGQLNKLADILGYFDLLPSPIDANNLQGLTDIYNKAIDELYLPFTSGENVPDYLKTDATRHNLLFRLVYGSRAKVNGGDDNYDIGWNPDIIKTFGSASFARRPVNYETKWEDDLKNNLTLAKDRVSKISHNGIEGYVYTDENGRIHPLTNDLLKLINGQQSPQKQNKEKERATDSATERETIPAPEYKNPFDPSLLISTAKYFAGLRGNRDIYQNLLDEMPEAPLRDPLDRKLAIVGWLERIKNGQNQLADLRRIQLMQQGSDQLTNFATALETERTGRDIMDKAFAEDSGRQFETAQKSWNLDNEDILYNTGVGDANRKSIADRQRMMAQIRAAWRSGDQNLKMGLLADTGNWFMKRYQREQDMVDKARELSLGTPEEWAQSEYTSRLGELANKKASDLTEPEKAKVEAVRAQVMREMRLNYSKRYYNLYHTPGFGGGFGYALLSKNGSKLEVAKLKARGKDNDRYVSMTKDLRKRRKR